MLLGTSAWIMKQAKTLQNTEPILKANVFEYPKHADDANSRSWQWGMDPVLLNALRNLLI